MTTSTQEQSSSNHVAQLPPVPDAEIIESLIPDSNTASSQSVVATSILNITKTLSQQIQSAHESKWWYEMIKNNPYFDVILVAAENVEIQSHRVLLAKYSSNFASIFKESKEIPVRIQMKDVGAETIRAGLDFMLDKFDSMEGKELSLLKFAAKYRVIDLMKVCCSSVEKSVDGSNVCEIIQIAYSNNFENLKKKCLKVLVENKAQIDAAKFNDLPKCILIDIIRF